MQNANKQSRPAIAVVSALVVGVIGGGVALVNSAREATREADVSVPATVSDSLPAKSESFSFEVSEGGTAGFGSFLRDAEVSSLRRDDPIAYLQRVHGVPRRVPPAIAGAALESASMAAFLTEKGATEVSWEWTMRGDEKAAVYLRRLEEAGFRENTDARRASVTMDDGVERSGQKHELADEATGETWQVGLYPTPNGVLVETWFVAGTAVTGRDPVGIGVSSAHLKGVTLRGERSGSRAVSAVRVREFVTQEVVTSSTTAIFSLAEAETSGVKRALEEWEGARGEASEGDEYWRLDLRRSPALGENATATVMRRGVDGPELWVETVTSSS